MAWLPLADEDPVPGDPFEVGELGAYFTGEAARLRAIVAELNRLDAGLWEGEAAEAFTRRRTQLVPPLEALATRWDRGGHALKSWARALDEARLQARHALAQARDADQRRAAAQTGLDAARDQAAADTRAALLAASTGLPGPVPDPSVILSWERQVADHQGDLAAARTLLGQAQELYETESRRCEGALAAAADDTVENRGGFLAGARRTIHHAVRRFPQIKTFAKYLGLAAGALGIAAALFTGAGGVALAAFLVGGLATTLDTALAVSGDGRWTTVAWDAFGLLTFGASRAFASAARGTAATAVAKQETRLASRTLKGVVAESVRGGPPLTGAAARSRLLRLYEDWKVFAPEAAGGLLPEGRNWLRAVTFWKEIEIPPTDVLRLSRDAGRYAGISRVFEGAGRAGDIRGVIAGEREILEDQVE